MDRSHGYGQVPDRPAAVQNIGAVNTGAGTMNIHGDVAGVSVRSTAADRRGAAEPESGADVGILTVLSVETAAVVEVLQRAPGYRTWQLYGGAQVHAAEIRTGTGPLLTVAMQTLQPGQRSAATAYQQMRRQFSPAIVLLVGIAGGIRPDVRIGDVVLADEVVYYDARRETRAGPQRRGQELVSPPVVRHRLNEFIRVHGDAVEIAPGVCVRVHRGPLGSGDAVITDRGSDIRLFLSGFNEKTLAVETEAAGVAHAFYEEVSGDAALRGWLSVRGISDLADAAKGTAHHGLAARHAASVLERLLPFLRLTRQTGQPV